jgi:hypothetical protein
MSGAYMIPGMLDVVLILPASKHYEMRVLLLIALFGTKNNKIMRRGYYDFGRSLMVFTAIKHLPYFPL